VIRQAGPAEADEIAGFLQVAYLRAYAGRHAMTAPMFSADTFRQRTADSLTRQLAQTEVVFLTQRDELGAVVATIGLRPGSDNHTGTHPAADAEVWGFYVDPARQHQGYGRALWSALMQHPQTSGYRQLYLHVVTGSVDAVAFYQRRGFSFDGTQGSWDWPSWTPAVHTPYRTMRRSAPAADQRSI
jgi:ribosomal protein S18 acetylase RimI-like enzyme